MKPSALSRLKQRIDVWNVELDTLTFTSPAHTIVNPWEYGKEGRDGFFKLLGDQPRVFFLGMNPGPWGMAQTGVPFGEVGMVRDWMGLTPDISKPEHEHPKRPVEGMSCVRKEVSGSRFWGLMRHHFREVDTCLQDQVVWPFCPLMWLKESGANLPPNQIRVAERKPMEEICDRALSDVLDLFQPEHLVAIGLYAEVALKRVRPDREVVRILHPSPASPAANKDWAGTVTQQLKDAGIW